MGVIIQHPSEIGPIQLCEFGSYDISEMYNADSGKKYYMSLPKHYFLTMVTRISLVNFLLSFVGYRYWIPFLVPLYVVQFFKINIFISWCQTINFSRRKLWIFFIIELIIFQIICVLVRMLLMKLWL